MITAVAPHPSQPSLFISGSRDSQVQPAPPNSLPSALRWANCSSAAGTLDVPPCEQQLAAPCKRCCGHNWSLPHAPLPTALPPCKLQDAATTSACALDDRLPSSLVPSGQLSNTASTTDN